MSQTPSGNRWERMPNDDTAPIAGAPAVGPTPGAPPAPGTDAGSRPAMTYGQHAEAEPEAGTDAGSRPAMTYDPDTDPAAPRATPAAEPPAAASRGGRDRWRAARRSTRIALVAVAALLLTVGLFGAGFAVGRTTAPDPGTSDTPVNQFPGGGGFDRRHGPDDGPDGSVPPDQGQPDQGQPDTTGTGGSSAALTSVGAAAS